jgi:toxin ParE1/3/4
MQVRWSPEAAEDLVQIGRRIEQDKPEAARDVLLSIYRGITSLEVFPGRGRSGKVEGTKELVIASLPYIVVYRLAKNRIEIVRVYHGAQDWP